MDTSTLQLVREAQQGSEPAAVKLIELFQHRIYSFLRRLSGNDADAADLTQKTFARVWRMLPTVTNPGSVSAWIHRVAYHAYVDWRRTQPAQEERSESWWECVPAREERPDQALVRTDLAQTLYAAVDRLEPELRDTVHLHYYQGLTLQETGEALDIAASTVKYRLRQALDQLQSEMRVAEAQIPTINRFKIA